MAKRKKQKISPSVIKFSIVVILSLAVGLLIFFQSAKFLKESDYFKIKSVKIIDPSLNFINKNDLRNLIGKNMFTLNLQDFQKKLETKYPEITDLKVVRAFPNQIHLAAKKRAPFAQTKYKNRYLTLDEKGILLSTSEKEEGNLPQIEGIKVSDVNKFSLGTPLRSSNVRIALDIIKAIESNDSLSSYKVENVDIDNPSKINLYLAKKIKVIIDNQKIAHKVKVLGFVLTQGKLNLDEVKYIDLRFKEPIIGKK